MKISSLTTKILQHNKSPKKQRKFRILLDAAFPKPLQFSKLSRKAHIVHAVYDLNLSRQADDKFIYQKATQENCCVVTIDEDFKKLVKSGRAGAIIIPADLSVEQIENVLIKYISGHTPEELVGRFEKIEK